MRAMSTPIRILLADDHTLVRTSLAKMLAMEPDLSVVGQAIDGHHCLELVAILEPDIVLMDIGMPGLHGIEATRQLRQSHPLVKVIALTTYAAEIMAEAMHEAGSVAYVQKDAPMEKLIETIRTVCDSSTE